MELTTVDPIPGASIFTPQKHVDDRGFFIEIFRENLLGERFVQANHSRSASGVLRGLHYHRKQSDAWYVVGGEAQAMLVDLRERKDPPAVATVDLTADEPRVLYIPPGIAHGFLAITDLDLIYWVSNYYDSTDEHGVAWDDPTISAPWRNLEPSLSERDRSNPKLEWETIDPFS